MLLDVVENSNSVCLLNSKVNDSSPNQFLGSKKYTKCVKKNHLIFFKEQDSENE